MKFTIVLLALCGYAVAQDAGSVQLNCRDYNVVQNAFFFFGTGFSHCAQDPFGQWVGYRCKFNGFPQKLYIKLLLTEGNGKFAPALTIHTSAHGLTINSDITECTTCNMTEYMGFDTSKCDAQTYWNTDDLEKGAKCVAQDFPSKSPSIVRNTYYYKLPLNNADVQANSKIVISVKVGQGAEVCSTLVELLPN